MSMMPTLDGPEAGGSGGCGCGRRRRWSCRAGLGHHCHRAGQDGEAYVCTLHCFCCDSLKCSGNSSDVPAAGSLPRLSLGGQGRSELQRSAAQHTPGRKIRRCGFLIIEKPIQQRQTVIAKGETMPRTAARQVVHRTWETCPLGSTAGDDFAAFSGCLCSHCSR